VYVGGNDYSATVITTRFPPSNLSLRRFSWITVDRFGSGRSVDMLIDNRASFFSSDAATAVHLWLRCLDVTSLIRHYCARLPQTCVAATMAVRPTDAATKTNSDQDWSSAVKKAVAVSDWLSLYPRLYELEMLILWNRKLGSGSMTYGHGNLGNAHKHKTGKWSHRRWYNIAIPATE